MVSILREDAKDIDYQNVVKCEKKYTDYINEHVGLVKDSYRDLFYNRRDDIHIPNVEDSITRDVICDLAFDISEHDASKYSDDEFYGYRKHYYPTEAEKYLVANDEYFAQSSDEEYNKAWMHHIENNYHHCEYWRRDENGHFSESVEPKDMTLRAVIHMICDWEAMSRKFKTETVEWWKDCGDENRKNMTQNSIDLVDILLPIVFK